MKKLVIIGGGINGAGIARDAAKRGWKVTLLEKNDFCSGTSWASSKLIHGGLRYLEHGEIGLVRESLREREILLRLHSYNVRPLQLLLAIYRHSPHRVTTLRMGMNLYEWLSIHRMLPRYQFFTADQLDEFEPGLDKRKLQGGLAYWDAQCVYPERLVLANLHSAEEYGAELLNYHEVVRFKRNGRKIFSVTAMDKLNSIEKEFEADMVVNSSGPWIDAVLQLGSMIRRRLIGGTRGSHIVVPRFENGPLHAIYTNAMVDGRPFFILPWRNYYLVGTTEVRHEDSQDELFPTYAEIDYLLEETHNCFPAAAPRRQDILFSYAGIRPLPYSTKKNPGAITRKHILIDHSKDGIDNLVSMVGGKLTTYRRMAEQAVDLIGKKTNDTTPSSTAIAPLWGGEPTGSLTATALNQTNQRYRIDETIQQHLIDLYGSHYHEVLELAASRPNGFEKLDSGESDISAQVIFAVKKEWAKKISDVMFRRTPAGLCPNLGFEAYRKAAEIMAVELKWSEIKKNEEIEDYKKFVKRFLLSHQH